MTDEVHELLAMIQRIEAAPVEDRVRIELDYELARRKVYPPFLKDREEWTTVAMLRAELDATPLTHVNREWREWELALAERQAVTEPGKLFYRVV